MNTPYFYEFFGNLLAVESDDRKATIRNHQGDLLNLLDLFIPSNSTSSLKPAENTDDIFTNLYLSLEGERIISLNDCGMVLSESKTDSRYFLLFDNRETFPRVDPRVKLRYMLVNNGFLSKWSVIREKCYSIISSLYLDS